MDMSGPLSPILIPPAAFSWASEGFSNVVGLGTAETSGLGTVTMLGLRKLDEGVLEDLLWVVCAGLASARGPKGGGGLRTGRYDSAYHSYQILDFPVSLHTET